MTEINEIDFFKPDILADPYPFYRTVAAEHPIIKVPGQNQYIVFSHALISEMLMRVEDFSSNFGFLMNGRRSEDAEIQEIVSRGHPFVDTLLTANPPRHTHFRRLVNLAFSKPRVNAMVPQIRTIARELIEAFATKGRCEFVEEFAIPLPVKMISGQLGLSHLPYGKIKGWTEAISDRLGGLGDRDRELECARELVEFQHVMLECVEARRKEPQPDLLNHLVEAEIDGERLSDGELLSVLQQLMAAGNITTTSTLAGGLLLLIEHPSEMRRACQDAAAIPNMVGEMLRLVSPAQGITRIVRSDTRLGDFMLPEGAMIMARIGAANRDPAHFSNPDEFDSDRRNVHRHLSFGYGIHLCVGNMLARGELEVAFEELLGRLEDIAIEPGAKLEYPPNMRGRSLKALPITFRER